jgi:hypothetical protein
MDSRLRVLITDWPNHETKLLVLGIVGHSQLWQNSIMWQCQQQAAPTIAAGMMIAQGLSSMRPMRTAGR